MNVEILCDSLSHVLYYLAKHEQLLSEHTTGHKISKYSTLYAIFHSPHMQCIPHEQMIQMTFPIHKGNRCIVKMLDCISICIHYISQLPVMPSGIVWGNARRPIHSKHCVWNPLKSLPGFSLFIIMIIYLYYVPGPQLESCFNYVVCISLSVIVRVILQQYNTDKTGPA